MIHIRERGIDYVRMANIHISLILHKGLMKNLNNCGEGNKEFIQT